MQQQLIWHVCRPALMWVCWLMQCNASLFFVLVLVSKLFSNVFPYWGKELNAQQGVDSTKLPVFTLQFHFHTHKNLVVSCDWKQKLWYEIEGCKMVVLCHQLLSTQLKSGTNWRVPGDCEWKKTNRWKDPPSKIFNMLNHVTILNSI